MSDPEALRRTWLVFVGAVGAILLIQLPTLLLTPMWVIDEAEIQDAGRALLNANTSWSVDWYPAAARPVHLLTYIGPCIQEFAYRSISWSPIGPRLSALLGASAAASCLLGWLLARGIQKWVAVGLALAFLLDPMLAQSYRGGRPDGWVLAPVLAACWIMARQATVPRPRRLSYILTGSLAVLAFTVWPTAFLLFPLLAFEVTRAFMHARTRDQPLRIASLLTSMVTGAVVTAALLLLPVAGLAGSLLHDLPYFLRSNGGVPSLRTDLSGAARALVYTPVLVGLTLCCLPSRRNRLFAGILVAVFLLVLFTKAYSSRLLYMLPYMECMVGLTLTGLLIRPKGQTVVRLGLAMILVWAVGLTLVARSATAITEGAGRDPGLLERDARTAVGRNHTIYLGAWEFYYAGRSLNWRMFNSWNTPTPKDMRSMLPHVDRVIFNASSITAQIDRELRHAGFRPAVVIPARARGVRAISRLLPLGGQASYGPYKVYKRP